MDKIADSAVAYRIGVDLGGTKIEAVAMAANASIVARERVATPREDYAATLMAIVELVSRVENQVGSRGLPVGLGHPGALSRATGRIKNANSTWLNGRSLGEDLQAALCREVRMANDADCLALSEAADGAAAGARVVFGAILGTGVGGGIVVDGCLLARIRLPGNGATIPCHGRVQRGVRCRVRSDGTVAMARSRTGVRGRHSRRTTRAPPDKLSAEKTSSGSPSGAMRLRKILFGVTRIVWRGHWRAWST